MTTRISVPRPPHAHIPRPRLVQRLDESAGPAVRVVQAPAGYGKTLLLAEWARGRPHDEAVVWMGLDHAHGDPTRFWPTLDARLARLPAAERGLPTSGAAEGPRESAMRRAGDIGMPLTVIIDHFDHLDTALAEDLLHWAASTDHVSLVIAARARPSVALATSVGAASVVSAADLQFDETETALLATALGVTLADATTDTLTREAEGWPLAIRIALQHVADGTAGRWRQNGDTVAEAQRAIVGDLDTHPGFAALQRASVAESLTPELARAFGLAADHASILSDAEERGLGWWESQDGERRFRLHPLIRRAVGAGLTAEGRGEAHRLLAQWLSDQDEPGAAFIAAIDGEQWDLARYLAYTAFTDVTSAMTFTPDLMARVPASVTRSDPMFGFLTALWHYGNGRTARAVSTLGSAFATTQRRRILAPGRVTPERVWAQGLLTAGLRLSGRYEFVEPALRRFESMLGSAEDPEGLLAPAMRLFANELAVTELYLGRLDEARESLTHAPRRPTRTKKQHFYADVLDAYILTRQGRFVDAQRTIDRLRGERLPAGFDESFYGIPLMLAIAALHLEDGAPIDAAAALRRTEAHWTTTENWPLLLVAHTEATWHRDGAVGALETLEIRRAEQHRRPGISPGMSALLRRTKAELLLAAGRTRDARQLLGAHPHHPLLAAVKAQTLLAEGRLGEAADAADTGLGLRGIDPRTRVDLLLLAAAAALRGGDRDAAARPFRHAAEVGLRHGMRTPFARLGMDERRLLLDAVSADDDIRDAVLARPALFPSGVDVPRLTKKELVALQDLARGISLPTAAERHRLSVNTIKAQRRTLYRKLGVSAASEAVARARELGLL
jgi:ATP/maltotriose-dependent transcriptional regulator MalT